MNTERRKYTQEFKQEAVTLSNQSTKSIAAVARNLGITPKLLYKWRAAQREQAAAQELAQSGTLAEVTRLRRELAEVRQERDILKKALCIFSRSV